MANQHTIETLTKDLISFKRSVGKRFTDVNDKLDTMQPQVQEMHDFIVDSKGFDRGQASFNKDGTIRISKDVWGLIVKLILIIGALVGIKQIT